MKMAIFKPMREGTKRRVHVFGWVIATGTLIGIFYGSLIGLAGWRQVLIGGCIGAIHGIVISSRIGLLEIFAVRTKIGRRIDQAPRDMGCPFLASNASIRLLEDRHGYRIDDRGPQTLRGRRAPMQVFEVSRNH